MRPILLKVKVNNEIYGRYSLPLDTPMEINLDEDGHNNILVIDGYEVYMKEADCPDQLCVQQGTIKDRLHACMPTQQITVEIIGNEVMVSISYLIRKGDDIMLMTILTYVAILLAK